MPDRAAASGLLRRRDSFSPSARKNEERVEALAIPFRGSKPYRAPFRSANPHTLRTLAEYLRTYRHTPDELLQLLGKTEIWED